jgi:hypothetical protein
MSLCILYFVFMDCPACHTENAVEAVACSACGRSLRSDSAEAVAAPPVPASRRSSSRRRRNANADDPGPTNDSENPAAWRAYRVSLWSLVPGLGLFLGPVAVLLGYQVVLGAGDDASARSRAKAAVFCGALTTLTQWLGVVLMIYGWKK